MIGQTQKELNNTQISNAKEGKGAFGSLMPYAATFLSIGAIKDFALDIATTTGKYEKYEAVLKNTFQSGSKAKQSMADLAAFAAATPFQIDQLTDSYIKLANRGFVPTMAEMTKLGDLASSTGKDFGMLTEAILDAETGEFERLKEFGIKANKEGNKIKFQFGDKQPTIIDNNSKAIRQYILSLGTLTGVQGSMNAISKTTEGQISNLKDSWDQLKLSIGSANSGVIKGAIEGLGGIVGAVKKWVEVPLSQKLSEERGEMNALVSVITDSNTSYEDRTKLLQQLQAQYPEYFKNIKIENGNYEQLLTTLDKVNTITEQRYKLQKTKEINKENQDALQQMKDEQTNQKYLLTMFEEAKAGNKNSMDALTKNISMRAAVGARLGEALNLLTLGGSSLVGMTGKSGFENLGLDINNQLKKIQAELPALELKFKMSENEQFKAGILDFQASMANMGTDKFAADKIKKIDQLKASMLTMFMGLQKMDVKEKNYDFIRKQIENKKRELESLYGVNTPTNNPGLNTGLTEIATGGRSIKNINVNVAKFQDQIVINEKNIPQNPEKLGDIIIDEFLRIINTANSVEV
jgi:hypothetical protein